MVQETVALWANGNGSDTNWHAWAYAGITAEDASYVQALWSSSDAGTWEDWNFDFSAYEHLVKAGSLSAWKVEIRWLRTTNNSSGPIEAKMNTTDHTSSEVEIVSEVDSYAKNSYRTDDTGWVNISALEGDYDSTPRVQIKAPTALGTGALRIDWIKLYFKYTEAAPPAPTAIASTDGANCYDGVNTITFTINETAGYPEVDYWYLYGRVDDGSWQELQSGIGQGINPNKTVIHGSIGDEVTAGTWDYQVRAYSQDGEYSTDDLEVVYGPPAQVTPLSVTDPQHASSFDVTWAAVSNAQLYRIYSGTGSACNSLIETIDVDDYPDDPIEYTLYADDLGGNGDYNIAVVSIGSEEYNSEYASSTTGAVFSDLTLSIQPDAPVLNPIEPTISYDGSIYLSWNEVDYATTGYAIHCTTAASGLGDLVATTLSTFYTHDASGGFTPPDTLYYQIVSHGAYLDDIADSTSNTENVLYATDLERWNYYADATTNSYNGYIIDLGDIRVNYKYLEAPTCTLSYYPRKYYFEPNTYLRIYGATSGASDRQPLFEGYIDDIETGELPRQLSLVSIIDSDLNAIVNKNYSTTTLAVEIWEDCLVDYAVILQPLTTQFDSGEGLLSLSTSAVSGQVIELADTESIDDNSYTGYAVYVASTSSSAYRKYFPIASNTVTTLTIESGYDLSDIGNSETIRVVDVPSTGYQVKFDNIPLKDVLKWCDRKESRITYWTPYLVDQYATVVAAYGGTPTDDGTASGNPLDPPHFQTCYWSDGGDSSGVNATEGANIAGNINMKRLPWKISKVQLLGGYVSGSQLMTSASVSGEVNYGTIKDTFIGIRDEAELYSMAEDMLTTHNKEFKQIVPAIIGEGLIVPGQTLNVSWTNEYAPDDTWVASDRMTLLAALTTASVTQFGIYTTVSNLSSTGAVLIELTNGNYKKVTFSDLTATTFTITETDFDINSATSGADVYVAEAQEYKVFACTYSHDFETCYTSALDSWYYPAQDELDLPEQNRQAIAANAAAIEAGGGGGGDYGDDDVRDVINEELVDGESIDAAIDTLISDHADEDDAHHTPYTDSDVQDEIDAALVDGEAIDAAIDTLIATHAGDDDAHHNPVTVNAPIVLTGQEIELKNDADAQVTEIDTDTTLAGGDTKIPTDLAVKTYVDNNAGGSEWTMIMNNDNSTRHFYAQDNNANNDTMVIDFSDGSVSQSGWTVNTNNIPALPAGTNMVLLGVLAKFQTANSANLIYHVPNGNTNEVQAAIIVGGPSGNWYNREIIVCELNDDMEMNVRVNGSGGGWLLYIFDVLGYATVTKG